jgi:SAM-dependent methyltransferase
MPAADSAEWFRRAFGRDYLRVYARRNEEEAERQVAFVLERVPLQPEDRILDLACGAGRHTAVFRRRGIPAIGLDLSRDLLDVAAQGALRGLLVQGDMRTLPFRGCFRLVTSFFSSFGYFATDDEDESALRQVRSVLREDGMLFLDYLNPDEVCRELIPADERYVDGLKIRQERWLSPGGLRVEKRITISGDGPIREYRESMRLFAREELEQLVQRAGFAIDATWGDFDGSTHSPWCPRTIILARTAQARSPCPYL